MRIQSTMKRIHRLLKRRAGIWSEIFLYIFIIATGFIVAYGLPF